MKTIRILIAVLGMDQHEVGAVAVSRLLRDAGMEIIYLGRFNTPAGIVKTSIEENADIIGLSCHSWEYLHYMPELLTTLNAEALDIPVVVGGSVITAGDIKKLQDMGVAAAFGPSATNDQIVKGIQELVVTMQK
jgi:methylmalonyl-CoA mutase C-terminal domain/subunit